MNKHVDDGGAAFPDGVTHFVNGFSGLSRRDWFATFAPEPSEATIEGAHKLDQLRNPHNDADKPKRRTREKIIAQYKFSHADAMIAASNV